MCVCVCVCVWYSLWLWPEGSTVCVTISGVCLSVAGCVLLCVSLIRGLQHWQALYSSVRKLKLCPTAPPPPPSSLTSFHRGHLRSRPQVSQVSLNRSSSSGGSVASQPFWISLGGKDILMWCLKATLHLEQSLWGYLTNSSFQTLIKDTFV